MLCVWILLKTVTAFLCPCLQNPEKYYGERSKASLTQFAMRFVTTKVMELWQGTLTQPNWVVLMFLSLCSNQDIWILLFFEGNVFTEIDKAFAAKIGWLITFCADTGGEIPVETHLNTSKHSGQEVGFPNMISQTLAPKLFFFIMLCWLQARVGQAIAGLTQRRTHFSMPFALIFVLWEELYRHRKKMQFLYR